MSSIHFQYSRHRNTKSTLNKMLSASDYWQPDKQSQWIHPQNHIGIAKAQLYNTARSKHDGVFFDKDLGLTISANARIDNRDALLTALGRSNDDSTIATDSQLILKAYAKWNSDCVQHLRGDFVFIIWDQNAKKTFCARDHFGVKVLFYSHIADGLMLTNEHNAFFTSEWIKEKRVEDDWLANALWGLTPTPFDSPDPNIHVLPPAHTLEFDQTGLRINKYWHLHPKQQWDNYSDEEWIQELKHRFAKAVSVRLDSDYPVGLELSEGIDSNGIAGFAARQRPNQNFYTFSYDCIAKDDNTEAVWGETYKDIEDMLAMHPNLKPVWRPEPEGNPALNRFQTLTQFHQHFGGVPPCNGRGLTRSPLAHSNNVRTMLSGWGGDHCVTSYGDALVDEQFHQGKLLAAFRTLSNRHQRGRGSLPLLAFAELTLRNTVPSIWGIIHRYRKGWYSLSLHRAKRHFLNKHWCNKLRLHCAQRQHLQDRQCHSIHEKEQLELFGLGVTRGLTESELFGRLSRVECRFPMVDVDLVEFAHSMPSHLKSYHGIERYAFRRVIEGVTTLRIQWRRKADVNHPNLNKKKQLVIKRIFLQEHLHSSVLARRFSKESQLQRCLQQTDPALLRSLELLVHAEAYYYPRQTNQHPAIDQFHDCQDAPVPEITPLENLS